MAMEEEELVGGSGKKLTEFQRRYMKCMHDSDNSVVVIAVRMKIA